MVVVAMLTTSRQDYDADRKKCFHGSYLVF